MEDPRNPNGRYSYSYTYVRFLAGRSPKQVGELAFFLRTLALSLTIWFGGLIFFEVEDMPYVIAIFLMVIWIGFVVARIMDQEPQ